MFFAAKEGINMLVLKVVFVFFVFLAWSPTAFSAFCPEWKNAKSKSAVYILAMGANTGKLRKADKDARDFANNMRSYYERNGKQPVMVCLLKNKAASKKNWQRAMTKLKKHVKQYHTVVFYFSGHGTYKKRGKGYCPEQFLIMGKENRLLDKTLMKELAALKTTDLRIFLDTCYASGMIRSKQVCGNKRSKFRSERNSGLYPQNCKESSHAAFLRDPTYINATIYAASKRDQDAFETHAGGLFTQTFLQMLNAHQRSSLDSIFHKAASKVTQKTIGGKACRQHPQRWRNGEN